MGATSGGIGGGRPCVPRTTYQTPKGVQQANGGLSSGGYEGPIVQIGKGLAPFFIDKLEVYLIATAGAPMWIQIFDGSFFLNQATNTNQAQGDVPDQTAGAPWNPISIFQVNPGQTLNWEPPREGAVALTWATRCDSDCAPYRQYYDDYGFPFEAGCIVAVSTTDQGFTPSGNNLVRLMARLRMMTAGAQHS